VTWCVTILSASQRQARPSMNPRDASTQGISGPTALAATSERFKPEQAGGEMLRGSLRWAARVGGVGGALLEAAEDSDAERAGRRGRARE